MAGAAVVVDVSNSPSFEDAAVLEFFETSRQFFEFPRSMTDAATEGSTVRFAPVLFQPIAGDEVAQAVGRSQLVHR